MKYETLQEIHQQFMKEPAYARAWHRLQMQRRMGAKYRRQPIIPRRPRRNHNQ
jgi:hypothetical protein